jgi:glycosyltransferase involved in cell wall biosynthesis
MQFSVITVCKNAVRTVRRAMDSVLAQTYPNVEIIVIDGASQDGTRESLEAIRARLTHFVSEPDHGIYHAMNKGTRLAAGDFVYFLNADDQFADARALENVADFLGRHRDTDFLYGDINVVRADGSLQRHFAPPADRALEEMIVGCLPHQGSFARRSLFERVGPFDESYRISGDYEWMLRVLQLPNVKLQHCPRVIANYFGGGLSASNPVALRESFRAQNEAAIFQTDDWLRRRVAKYQEALVRYRGMLMLDREKQEMAAHLEEANVLIEAMKRSVLCLPWRATRWAGRWARLTLRGLQAG